MGLTDFHTYPDKNIKPFAAVMGRAQYIIIRYLKTLSVDPVYGFNPRPPALYNVN